MLARERRDWAAADAGFERAVAINGEHQLPWDEGKALYEWGRMLTGRDRAGGRDRARERLVAALALFERVRAARDVETVRAALEPLRA